MMVHVGEKADCRSVGRPQKSWIDIVKDCLNKRKMFGCQANKEMVNDSSEW